MDWKVRAPVVCVMLTAMTVAHLPPALVRSGRVELWLEMKLPDESARQSILSEHLAGVPAVLRDVDLACLSSASEGFTGSDLKRLIEDGKGLSAYDQVKSHPSRSATEYFLGALETVRQNKGALLCRRSPSDPARHDDAIQQRKCELLDARGRRNGRRVRSLPPTPLPAPSRQQPSQFIDLPSSGRIRRVRSGERGAAASFRSPLSGFRSRESFPLGQQGKESRGPGITSERPFMICMSPAAPSSFHRP